MTSNIDNSGRGNLLPIARDVIKHAKAGTMRKAKDVMRLPASNYTDDNRFQEEDPLAKSQIQEILKLLMLQVHH